MKMNFVLIITAIVVAVASSEESICVENSKPCLRNIDCCDNCCNKEKCVAYSDNCVKEKNPCYLHECPPNMVCYLQKVQCIQAPCYPVPACKPIDYDY